MALPMDRLWPDFAFEHPFARVAQFGNRGSRSCRSLYQTGGNLARYFFVAKRRLTTTKLREADVMSRVRRIAPWLHLKENRNDKDRDNVHDLDHRIDRGTGGVFVGIAHSIAGD